MATVIALVHKSEAAFGVSFPDFPGLISGGTTAAETLQRAREGLALHIECMADDGDRMPIIRSLDDLRADAEFSGDFATAATIALFDITPFTGADHG